MDALTLRFQQLLINKFVEDGMAREVDLRVDDSSYTAIRRVTDTFKSIYPTFKRKVKFINLEAELGECVADTARRLDKLKEPAELENTIVQELTLMKFCAIITD